MKKTYIVPAAHAVELLTERLLSGSNTGQTMTINDETADSGYSQWTQKKDGGFWSDNETAE